MIMKISLILMIILMANNSYAEMYKWVDSNGATHFSDKKPDNENTTDVVLNPSNIFDDRKENSDDLSSPYVKDEFKMPFKASTVPYRFVMTSAMNVDEPVDRLSEIKISLDQKSFYSYVKLTGVESGVNYNLRIRIIDEKGELVFDKNKELKTRTNSLWFAARISPSISIDEPGDWTIQATLNNKKLFSEKRLISFNQKL
jgi:hypothetical protein